MGAEGQIQLSKLLFTLNWEDGLSDETAIGPMAGKRLFCISSGGCNAIGFLRFAPDRIDSLDINPAQTWLIELKQAAFRRLDHPAMLAFLGLRPHPDRVKTYRNELTRDLSAEARNFWDANQALIEKGILFQGRFERFIRLAALFIRLLQGPAKTRRAFELEGPEEQARFFDEHWNNRRWRFLMDTLFNKKRLAKRGLNADYFTFDDGSRSFSESFQRRARHAFTELPVKDNHFLALYLLGSYLNEDAVPEYLKEENFEAIKRNIDRLHPVTGDAKYWLEGQPEGEIDGFALSNICELMDLQDTHKLFTEIARTGSEGARLCFRNLMVPREVPGELAPFVRKDEELSVAIAAADRSFIYGKVAAYRVFK